MTLLLLVTQTFAALAGIALLVFLLVPVVCAVGGACLDVTELHQN